ncbi:hypothetical protein G210_3685 [Candida maltosa Xu316]|uniref:Uncharacterized protein n=1 Tax=Candida maltosa (strain Xu316) TaxID=1245528 RepID=M3HFT8_CANMX|nr:hypothetical protein G210_3685 [Candida maltosa Xu316]
MSSFIVKYIANRVLKDNQWNKLGVEDPYYEYVTIDIKPNGDKKFKKIPRRIPDGISNTDLNVLQTFKKKAYRYDYWFNIFGVSFGWTNIVGIIPVVGAIISTFWSLQLLLLARSLDNGFPLDLQILFVINIAIDFGLGLIPFVGSIFEIGYKANSRNYLLLEKHLIRIGEMNLGLIKKEEVRPGFINDKVQPFVEDTLKPGAIKTSEQILELLNRKPRSLSHSSSNSSISGKATSAATTTSNATVTTSSFQHPRSGATSAATTPNAAPTGDKVTSKHGIPDESNPVYNADDSISIRSIRSLNGSEKSKKNKRKSAGASDSPDTSLSHHNVSEF